MFSPSQVGCGSRSRQRRPAPGRRDFLCLWYGPFGEHTSHSLYRQLSAEAAWSWDQVEIVRACHGAAGRVMQNDPPLMSGVERRQRR
jgi:hypothetical protein